MKTSRAAAVDLYWIPLGAGGHSVRFNGVVFEGVAAAWHRRPRCALYHAALVVLSDGESYAIELAPSPDGDGASRGVVATGAVGSRWLSRLRLFRYELRCCPGGRIPDLGAAVGGPRRVSEDPLLARRILDLVPDAPVPVWGRDELDAGEMWNSNSVTAWLLARAGSSTEHLQPPLGGRAPGWVAGLRVARRGAASAPQEPSRDPETAVTPSQSLDQTVSPVTRRGRAARCGCRAPARHARRRGGHGADRR